MRGLFGSLRLVLAFLLLVGIAAAWALLPAAPRSGTVHAAEQWRHAHLKLELAMARAVQLEQGGQEELVQSITQLDHHFAALHAELVEHGLSVPELAAMTQGWTQLRATLGRTGATAATSSALRAQTTGTQAVVNSVRKQLDSRLDDLQLWLKALLGLLVLTLLVSLFSLGRQRQHLRESLHQFSNDFGAGEWQDAVQKLRDERSGAPSAFDALATGVEQVMSQSERRWQALADLSADWYWETDAEHRIRWLSRSASFLAEQGWQVDDVLGQRHDQVGFFRPPSQGWRAMHEHLAQQREFRDLEFQVGAQRGPRVIWVALCGRPRVDANGQFMGYEGVGRDVTERKNAQERLAASEQRWSTMAGLASDWYWETDTQHRMQPLRPELRMRYGHLFDHVEGKTRWDAYRESLTPEQWAEHRSELEAHRPFRGLELEAQAGDGSYLWMSLSGIARIDAQGRFRGYHGVGRDITARKEAEHLLMRHNEALQRAVAERTAELQQVNLDLDAFARQLAHELRNPISQVKGLAGLLQSRLGTRLTAEEAHLLELQMNSAQHMTDTVDALISLARSTLLPLPRHAVNLSVIAQEAAAALPAIARVHPLRWHIQPGLWVQGNAAALKIVLANLFSNAAKFTSTKAQPQVHVEADEAVMGKLTLRIFDNGVGFPPGKVGELFRPFQRLHAEADYGGTGLGLTIVARIIERHGGKVSARQQEGGGACFELSLDAASPPASLVRPRASEVERQAEPPPMAAHH